MLQASPTSHPPLSCCVFSQRCLVNVESGIKQVCSFQLSLLLDMYSLPLPLPLLHFLIAVGGGGRQHC